MVPESIIKRIEMFIIPLPRKVQCVIRNSPEKVEIFLNCSLFSNGAQVLVNHYEDLEGDKDSNGFDC